MIVQLAARAMIHAATTIINIPIPTRYVRIYAAIIKSISTVHITAIADVTIAIGVVTLAGNPGVFCRMLKDISYKY